jgi:hypothetical protein
MTAPVTCQFLHCEAEKPLLILFYHAGRDWGLCPFHEKLVKKNGASIEHDSGREYLFSPAMMRGKAD